MAINLLAVFRILARDIDARAPTVRARLPDNEMTGAAAACEGLPLARYPYRKVRAELDGSKVWWRFRFGRARPPACIPAGPLPAVQVASRAMPLCPLPCNRPLFAIAPTLRGPSQCTPHPSTRVARAIAGRASPANRTGQRRIPFQPTSLAIATPQIAASGARNSRSLEMRAPELRASARNPANPPAQTPVRTRAREIFRSHILQFAPQAAEQN